MKVTLTSLLLIVSITFFAQEVNKEGVRDLYCNYLHLNQRDSAEWILQQHKKLFTKQKLSNYILSSYAYVEHGFGDISFYSTRKFRRLMKKFKRRGSNDIDYLDLQLHLHFLNEEYQDCIEAAESCMEIDSLPSHYETNYFPNEWMNYKHASQGMIALDEGEVLMSVVEFSKVNFQCIDDWGHILLNYSAATSYLRPRDSAQYRIKKSSVLAIDSITDLINYSSQSVSQHQFSVTSLIRSYLVLYDSKLDWNIGQLEYFSDKFHRDLAMAGEAVKILSLESQKNILEAVAYDFFEREEGGALELEYACRRTKSPVICDMQKYVESDYESCYEEIDLLEEELE